MEILPTSLGTRPRLAVEVRVEGVVSARAEDAAALLTAVGGAHFEEGALAPGLKPGNVLDRAAVVAAVRTALDSVAVRGGGAGAGRGRDVTLIVPDAAVRVLLLDFDQLPGKAAEALPVVRFRLKKLLPFDVDEAMVSYQVMPSGKGEVRVVAVAMPKSVLDEYEGVVTAAGYLAGAVLPSTLAALAGLDEPEGPALVVNAGAGGVTTAIVQAGTLLLHRSVDMSRGADVGRLTPLSLVDRESTAEEWAKQEALSLGGYDRFAAALPMQTEVLEHPELMARTTGYEIGQAVSVAAAYFEDTLQVFPETVLAAGPFGTDALAAMLRASGLEGMRVRDMVENGMLEAGAVTSTVPRSWLAGVRGALKS
jgi:type IV pilus assembly protein PilM